MFANQYVKNKPTELLFVNGVSKSAIGKVIIRNWIGHTIGHTKQE